MTHPHSKAAEYRACAERGLTVAQTAEAMGVQVGTARAYAKSHRISFVDFRPYNITLPTPPKPDRDVLVIRKASFSQMGEYGAMRVSLPKPPFEIDIRRSA